MDLLHHDEERGKALHAPIGAASPLWWAFAGAASAGVAYWLWTRWARPVNLEAALPRPVTDPVLTEAAATYELEPEAIEEATTPEPPQTSAAAPDAASPQALEAPAADDLTRIRGVGPKMAALLAERGITRYSQVADWTLDDIATLDREMKLLGRVGREDWVGQARAMVTD